MVIHKTRQLARRTSLVPIELGEWAPINRAAGRVLATPIRPEALIPSISTGRGPGAMVPRPTSVARDASTGTSVYLYYDKHDLLIYVGITDRGIRRNREHDARAEWWRFVARQEVEHHLTRDAALRREKLLIIDRQPPFNRQHNRNHAELRSAYLAWQSAGLADADPEELARKIGRNLPLVLTEIGDDRFALQTLPEHCSIAHHFDDLTGTLVVAPRRIGRVVAQRTAGMHAFIMVERRRGYTPPLLGSAAVAVLRFAAGGRFRIAQIEVTTRSGG